MPIRTLDEYLKQVKYATTKQLATKLKYVIIGFYKETEFQETLIGKIPKEWSITKLRNVAKINESKVNIANLEGKVARIPMELIPDDGIYTKYVLMPINEIKSYITAKAGDILLAKITPSFENGKQGIVPDDVPHGIALVTTEVYPITPINIERLFLFYLLKWRRYRKLLEWKMTGTTGRRRVPKNALENLLIPLPPLSEQWGIAEVLSTVDRAIEKTEKLIERLERLKKALMQELLTKGIGHKKYKQTSIGKIPKEWKVVKLKDVAKIETHSIIPKPGVKYYYIGLEDIESDSGRILKSKEMLTDGAEIKSTKYIFTTKHVLYGKLRPYLNKVALPPRDGICSTDILPILPNTTLILREYLAYVLRHKRFVIYATARMKGTNHPRVNPKDILIYEFPLPPIEEQQEIVNILISIDRWIELEKKRKEKLKRLKKGLMNLLLTGRIRVKVVRQDVFTTSSR